MSLVAKVFVVLNLLVAVAFLVFAMNVWTAGVKYQRLYEVEKTANIEALANAQKVQVEMTRNLATTDSEKEALKTDKAKLVVEKGHLLDEKLETQAELDKTRNSEQMLKAKEEEWVRENSRLKDEMLKLHGIILKAQQGYVVERENATRYRNEKSEMETELNQVKIQLASTLREKHDVEENLAKDDKILTDLMAKGVPLPQILGHDMQAVQPALPDAQVLAVKPELGLVVLSVGSQQSIKPGYEYTISRGDQYIGRVQVAKVYDDMCSAKISLMSPGQEVQVHDEARGK